MKTPRSWYRRVIFNRLKIVEAQLSQHSYTVQKAKADLVRQNQEIAELKVRIDVLVENIKDISVQLNNITLL